MLSLISFIFLMYEIEKNSLQDHLRNYMERLKFVISCIFILCLRLPLLSSITSLLNCSSPGLLPRLFFPPAFKSHCRLPFLPQPHGNPDSAHSLGPSLSLSTCPRHYTQRCFRHVSSFAATCSSVSLLSADHSLSDFPSSGLYTRFFCLRFRL